jgi:hypothetical protein
VDCIRKDQTSSICFTCFDDDFNIFSLSLSLSAKDVFTGKEEEEKRVDGE